MLSPSTRQGIQAVYAAVWKRVVGVEGDLGGRLSALSGHLIV